MESAEMERNSRPKCQPEKKVQGGAPPRFAGYGNAMKRDKGVETFQAESNGLIVN